MAGNTTRIDDVVDSALVDKQLSDAKKATSELKKEFIDTLKAANDLNNAIGRATNTRDYNKSVQDAAIATERLAQAQIRTQTAQERLTQATIRTQQAQDRQTQSAQKASGAYQVLNAAYQEATQLARNAGAQFGENSKQFQNAAKSANFLRERLDAIDRPLGNYQRNVGNYRSAFDGLGNSINQLTREFPAFAVSAQTGILALSNNIPIFFDQIRRTRQEVAALRAEGQQAPGVFSRLISSLFSWGTALSLGVTLLTIYGKEVGNFVSALFKGKEALDIFAERQKAVNAAISSQEFKDGVSNFNELKTNIELAKQGLIDKDAVLKQYNETLGKTTGFAKDFNEAEKLTLERGDKVIQLLVLKASAQNLLAKASEKATERALELNKTELEAATFADRIKGGLNFDLPGLFESEAQVREREAKKTLERQKQLGAARRAQNAEDLKKEEQQFIKAFQDVQKSAAEFAKNNGLSFTDLSKPEKEKKKKDTSSEDELTALEYQYNQQIELARAKDKENAELEKDYLKQIENYRKEVYEGSLTMANNYYGKQAILIEQARQFELQSLADQYKNGEFKTAEYNQRKKDLEDTYSQESVKTQIALAEDLISVKKEFGNDTSKDEIELARLQIRLAELVTNKKIEGIEKEKAKRQELNAAIKNLAEEAGNFIISLVDAGFTNRKNQIESQKEDLEKQTQQEIDAVDRSLGTEQEKADKIALIKAKQQSQNEIFARQQKKIDIEKAKFDKAVSIARIIENTAIGITSALAQFPPNVPLSILIGALGAVQLGTVLAQPIPQYAKGTKNAKGGLSIIGEEGAEKVDLPNGKSFISANTAQLINLPAGTKVTPHGETMRMIGKPDDLQKYTGGQQVPWDELISELRKNRPQKSKQNINVHVHGSYEAYKAQRLNGRL